MCIIVLQHLKITASGLHGNALRLNDDGNGYAKYNGEENEPCFSDTENCPTGFTMMVWLKIGELTVETTKFHYISSGSPRVAATGFAIFSDLNELQVHLRTPTQSWDWLTAPFPVFHCEFHSGAIGLFNVK